MHRDFHRYPTFQRQGSWTTIVYPEARDRHIGILGCGYLDGEAARCLLRLGFSVAGWSRTPKAVEGIESFAGDDALIPFLERTRILVCILRLTPETTGILDARTLAALPEGANLINVGRGAHVVDEDLIAALDSGPPGRRGAGCVPHRAPARRRPLVAPSQDPVDAPPHAAGRAQGDGSPREVAENIARIRAGQPPRLTADPDRGY